MGTLWLFLAREWADTRRNSRVLPLFLIMPIIMIALPLLLALLAPALVPDARVRQDPSTLALLHALSRSPEFAAWPPAEGVARYLLRATLGVFLLMPIAMASTAAAFSIVGEKQQRTLEPILATPITDRQLLLGKLVACSVPTIGVTVAAGLIAMVGVDIIFATRGLPVPLPDRFWALTLLVLAPALTVAVGLVTMRLSARSSDPQATVQTSALAILPAFLLIVALLGPMLVVSFPGVCAACVVVLLIDVALFRMNVVRFRREEILTTWK